MCTCTYLWLLMFSLHDGVMGVERYLVFMCTVCVSLNRISKWTVFGQKLPFNAMIRAKERWFFGTLLHVYVSFLFLHQTTRLIKYTTNVMIDVAKKGRRNKFASIRISCSL